LSILKREVARVFKPLLPPARYKGAHGGRGSGKSHFFAEEIVMDSLEEPGNSGDGLRTVCIREVLKDLSDSAKRLIEDKLKKFSLGEADGFKVYRNEISTPKDGVIIFRGMQDQNAESIKSLENFKRAWIEEAQTLSKRSLTLLRPTIRAPGSEIWASWNPRRKSDAVDDFMRRGKPDNAVVVEANWRDNPWFPSVLEDERLHDKEKYPDRYDHIWEGDYAKVYEGAYFARLLDDAKREGRIGRVSADPLLPLRGYVDIGGAGANADAFTIWIVQYVGMEIRVSTITSPRAR
jgi:phage terminase large subunit